jgi:hypothetical protein
MSKKVATHDARLGILWELTKSNLFSTLQREKNPQTVTFETGQAQNKP